MASQITSLTIVYSIVYSGTDERKHQSSVSLAFVRGIHRRLVNSQHKWPVPRKMFPFDDVIMLTICCDCVSNQRLLLTEAFTEISPWFTGLPLRNAISIPIKTTQHLEYREISWTVEWRHIVNRWHENTDSQTNSTDNMRIFVDHGVIK